MSVLVDSSIWIEYFRGSRGHDELDLLIEEDLVVVNDLILAELIPALHLRRQRKLIGLMREIARPPLDTDWDDIVQMQILCLRHGINKVGIPDLMIAQHAIQNGLELYSQDKHFALLARHVPLVLH
ncbi:MAG: PIN domain-containing protein [Candidatus Pacebacteria bacterium]|nr:PIN domain-containing protein [Candidatus Paceibacterota bacterium]